MYPLLTDRVLIEPLQQSDAPAFAAYRQDPDIARWQSWTIAYSTTDALALINSQPTTALPPPGEWLQLAVHSTDSYILYGDVAVHAIADQPDTYEVGITFAPAHHGQGLATEALARVVQYLFADDRAHRVIAFRRTPSRLSARADRAALRSTAHRCRRRTATCRTPERWCRCRRPRR